ncbi:MAG: hypothetical protein A3E83_00665 [Gammaproteobacteria bacterium RIFCSPHIGHO2_12_FULL_41_20]|nr:MAG: hypothetical protein A3E83_00665 [Gammaproteobacteria bacterium RIFCSPHIGHO2_12_FULL_41_20]
MALSRTMGEMKSKLQENIEKLRQLAAIKTAELASHARDFYGLVAQVSFLEIQHWEDIGGARGGWRKIWREESVMGRLNATIQRLSDAFAALQQFSFPAMTQTRLTHDEQRHLGKLLVDIDAAADFFIGQVQAAQEYIHTKTKEPETRHAALKGLIAKVQQLQEQHLAIYQKAKQLEAYQAQYVTEAARRTQQSILERGNRVRVSRGYVATVAEDDQSRDPLIVRDRTVAQAPIYGAVNGDAADESRFSVSSQPKSSGCGCFSLFARICHRSTSIEKAAQQSAYHRII